MYFEKQWKLEAVQSVSLCTVYCPYAICFFFMCGDLCN